MADNVFLVHLKAYLVGGKKLDAFDVIPADDPIDARNIAVNFYLAGGGEQAVDFGGVLMFPGAICSVEAVVLAAVDISNAYNTHWKRMLERAEDIEGMISSGVDKFNES